MIVRNGTLTAVHQSVVLLLLVAEPESITNTSTCIACTSVHTLLINCALALLDKSHNMLTTSHYIELELVQVMVLICAQLG
jgi:hypothetical protein